MVTKEQLQLKTLVDLRGIAKDMGIQCGTKGFRYNKEKLITKIISKQENQKVVDKFITLRISCSCTNAVVSVVEKEELGTTTIQKVEEESKYYYLKELHKMAKEAGIKHFAGYNRKELHKMLGLKLVNYNNIKIGLTLTNVETGVVQEFKHVKSLTKKLGVGHAKLYYGMETGNPVVLKGVSYVVKKN